MLALQFLRPKQQDEHLEGLMMWLGKGLFYVVCARVAVALSMFSLFLLLLLA
jgi:hypothetical protein